MDKKSDLGSIVPWSSIAVVFFLKKKRSSNFSLFTQVPVVPKVDSAVHWMDSATGFLILIH